jgi:gentisate 1,2-dioxygenase
VDLNEHDSYCRELSRLSFLPGWERTEPAIWLAPKPKFQPYVWRFAEAKAALEKASRLVTTEETERRNLIMVNPVMGNHYATTRNIVAAYQMIKGGERARSHRHSPNALRLVIEAKGDTYTVVDGVRIDMADNDVVVTPSWCWHGHANEGAENSYWIDFLDVPFVQHLESMFFEPHPERFEKVKRNDPASRFRIPSSQSLGNGKHVRNVQIAKGIMTTIGLHLICQPGGTHTDFDKSTANNLYAVIAGRALFTIDGIGKSELTRGDVIAVPCWYEHRLDALDDSSLLRVTDEPLFSALHFLRDEA